MVRLRFQLLTAVCAAWPLAAGLTGAQSPALLSPKAAPPPMPPVARPPTELFRQLLRAAPLEREQLLAAKPPPARQVILNGLREYEALAPGERELRLHTLELGWYLDPLLRLGPSNRLDRLASLPGAYRAEVEDRLQHWDQVPAELQKQLLAYRPAIFPGRNAVGRGIMEPGPSLEQSELKLRIQQLFELNEQERTRVLSGFSDAQRAELRKAVLLFANLPRSQRDTCVEGLTRFATMSAEERREFIRNCDRWKTMSESERAVWRRLVASQLRRPPLPPGATAPNQPPLPPRLPSAPRAPGMATNR
jgi:hypothetical protein